MSARDSPALMARILRARIMRCDAQPNRMQPSRERGFTLIEVVIALSLVSLIMLGLVSALSTLARTGERLERKALESDDVRLVFQFLRQSIESASVRPQLRPSDGVESVWFEGDGDSIQWLGLLPARQGLGGLYHLRLFAMVTSDGGQLLLKYRPYSAQALDWEDAPTHVVLSGLDHLTIAYRYLGAREWQGSWRDALVLPGGVKISLSVSGVPWPDLVVSLLQSQPGSASDAPQLMFQSQREGI